MCLEIKVNDQGALSDADLASLSAASGLVLARDTHEEIHISRELGCSCSMMSDNADWNASSWEMDPAVLPGLETVARLLGEQAKEFQFSAFWFNEAPARTRQVRLADLLSDIRENRISNGERYAVGGAAKHAGAADSPLRFAMGLAADPPPVR